MNTLNKWLTVRETAEILSLSPEMIYKMAKQGEVPAVRFGTSWRIDRTDLESWLQSKKLPRRAPGRLSSVRREGVSALLAALRDHYGKRFVALYIYGSTSRAEDTEESDLDVLVVLKDIQDRWREMRTARRIAYDVTFGQGRCLVISSLVATESEFRGRLDPLFERIRAEGRVAA